MVANDRVHLFIAITRNSDTNMRMARYMLDNLSERRLREIVSCICCREPEPTPIIKRSRDRVPVFDISSASAGILGQIGRACREHRMSWAAFGRQCVHDPKLVTDLMSGRVLRPATEARVHAFIAGLGEAPSC